MQNDQWNSSVVVQIVVHFMAYEKNYASAGQKYTSDTLLRSPLYTQNRVVDKFEALLIFTLSSSLLITTIYLFEKTTKISMDMDTATLKQGLSQIFCLLSDLCTLFWFVDNRSCSSLIALSLRSPICNRN